MVPKLPSEEESHPPEGVISPRIPAGVAWLTVADLAVILGLKRQTIYNRLCSCPETLPPATRVPKLRGPRWSLRIVREWQARFDPVELDDPPRRPGRPAKAEEVARRLRAGNRR